MITKTAKHLVKLAVSYDNGIRMLERNLGDRDRLKDIM